MDVTHANSYVRLMSLEEHASAPDLMINRKCVALGEKEAGQTQLTKSVTVQLKVIAYCMSHQGSTPT